MSYTCVSCGLSFNDAGSQREHMKSEWHRYNLKRRVAQLPSIDEDTFSSKIAALSITTEAIEEKSHKKQITKKELRRQQKESLQKQKLELLQSAKQAILAKMKEEGNELAVSTIEQQEVKVVLMENDEISEEKLIAEKIANRINIAPTTCLFCPGKSQMNFGTIDENIHHMFKSHGLYIPEKKYLTDAEGLLSYLGEKIGFGNVCLVCSYQGRNIEAVREHMQKKRHMKIPYESEDEKLEISDFFDFSSTYETLVADVDVDSGEWEDVSDEESSGNDSDNNNDIPVEENPIVNMGTELVLPSGAVVGHRSMAKYYRQNLPPDRVLSEGQGTVVAAETRHFVSGRSRQELTLQKRAWSMVKKREDVNDRHAQKFINNQPHFRDPLLQ